MVSSINFVSDGIEALDYLYQKGKFKDMRRPDLILLDLSLPKKDGREVLKEIKECPHLKSIPVLVLPTSNSDKDVRLSYELYASAYSTKPNDLDEYRSAVKNIENFWCSAVLPYNPKSQPAQV